MDSDARRPMPKLSVFRNWLSLVGLVVVMGCLFAFVLLLALDLLAPTANPYLGILAYLLVPAFLVLGLLMLGVGLIIERRRIVRSSDGKAPPLLLVDFSHPHARRRLTVFVASSVAFLLLVAVASYRSYHFSESAGFCGQTCHTVMQPEYATYLHSPHARISCAECHIGPGAAWYVKAKISGLYQVYATTFNKFERPIRTPVRNLRPAQETCEQCHWPQKFAGNLERTYSHFLADKTNTPFTVRLLLKVGGGDPTQGPVGGIHWHMNVGNKVQYVAGDDLRQVIPWVRVTDPQGVVTEYMTPGFKPDPAKDVLHTMDCMDCHNRPAHIFRTPNDAVDLSMTLGKIDPTIPEIKKTALQVLTQTYTTEQDAMQKIATALHAKYDDGPRSRAAIDEAQQIYRGIFFPEMKTNWKVHPDNLGHKDSPGCFRCHDGNHKSADGKQTVKANDCTACHVIIAQGSGAKLQSLNPLGQQFEHPGGDIGDMKCNECHNGELQ